MRARVALLLLPLVAAGALAERDSVTLREPRAWRGQVEVASRMVTPEGVEGGETHTEYAEFLMVTEPPRRSVMQPRLLLQMREARGSFRSSLKLNGKDRNGSRILSGRAEGDLFPSVSGVVTPANDGISFEMQVAPRRISMRTTETGIHNGKLAVFRSVMARTPYLHGFRGKGRLERGGRFAQGRKVTEDRRGKYVREVVTIWQIERIDPVVEGRVTGQDGVAIAGLRIVARGTNPARRRKKLPPLAFEATTDKGGRFSIGVWTGAWTVAVIGEVRGPVVIRGEYRPSVQVRFEESPDLEIRLKTYRHDWLPYPHLLKGYFEGDVWRYFEHLEERVSERRLEVAEVETP